MEVIHAITDLTITLTLHVVVACLMVLKTNCNYTKLNALCIVLWHQLPNPNLPTAQYADVFLN